MGGRGADADPRTQPASLGLLPARMLPGRRCRPQPPHNRLRARRKPRKGGGAGARTSGPASLGRRRKCVGPAAVAAQMRPRGRRPTRRWRRVLQGPSRMTGLALASVLEKG